LQIWRAGVAAVDSERLVRAALRVEGDKLLVGTPKLGPAERSDQKPTTASDSQQTILSIDLSAVRRIVVVGAGKAGAGMAAGCEAALGPRIMAAKQVRGWLNVPADCVRPLQAIHLHAARAPGQNEPMPEGVAGAEEILQLVSGADANDLCLALISGGASALLPAPAEGVTLADKLALTRHLSAAGADIHELNTVRKQLSRIKGGGLARACRAGRLITLIISDVIGDPLDVIGSGPTIEDPRSPADALAILERYDARAAGVPQRVFDHLRSRAGAKPIEPTCDVTNLVIANIATGVDAAAAEAQRLGYTPSIIPLAAREGLADDVGAQLARAAIGLSRQPGPDCLVSGGEPVVKLAEPAIRGLGGRNQQLALAALQVFAEANGTDVAFVSGGTDGEDGPCDAAGAVVDAQVIAAAQAAGLDPADFLRRNDAYHFFEPLDALVKTGPTQTNVGDLRVAVTARIETGTATAP
jgi:hydroxypyruvate reductase